MTKQELQKLSRQDLIEMLLAATRENEQLHADLDDAKQQLEDREAAVQESGSVAQAALCLNGVLEAARAAADQYLENIRMRDEQQDYVRMKQETLRKCNRMLQATQAQVDDYMNQVHTRLQDIRESCLRENSQEDLTLDSELLQL